MSGREMVPSSRTSGCHSGPAAALSAAASTREASTELGDNAVRGPVGCSAQAASVVARAPRARVRRAAEEETTTPIDEGNIPTSGL